MFYSSFIWIKTAEGNYLQAYVIICLDFNHLCAYLTTAVVAQWVRAFASHAEFWELESQLRQTVVLKAISDRSTANCLAQV